jgi:lipopolysaccharide/colanic/teichoic acid biosynthesis glycosyltransferase
MWKLRTMRPAGAGGATITSGDDDRITPIGRRLRHYRLDELPNLVNVVAGQMALIGPRPETPGMVDATDPRWRQVLAARPAIAGPTQLVCADWEADELRTGDAEDVYRHKILPVKLAIDAWYVEHASPRIDAEVLVALVQRFALGRAETVVHRRVWRSVPAAAVVPRSAVPRSTEARPVGGRGDR